MKIQYSKQLKTNLFSAVSYNMQVISSNCSCQPSVNSLDSKGRQPFLIDQLSLDKLTCTSMEDFVVIYMSSMDKLLKSSWPLRLWRGLQHVENVDYPVDTSNFSGLLVEASDGFTELDD